MRVSFCSCHHLCSLHLCSLHLCSPLLLFPLHFCSPAAPLIYLMEKVILQEGKFGKASFASGLARPLVRPPLLSKRTAGGVPSLHSPRRPAHLLPLATKHAACGAGLVFFSSAIYTPPPSVTPGRSSRCSP